MLLLKLLSILLISIFIGICQLDAEQCVPVKEKPKPKLNTVKKTTAVGTGICLIASMKAHLKIGNDEYVELNDGHTVGHCVKDSTLSDLSDQFVFEFTCGSVIFYLKRTNTYAPWWIEAILVDSPVIHLFHLKPIDDDKRMQVMNANHSYRCKSEQTILMRKGTSTGTKSISLVLSDMTIEAFRDPAEPELHQQRDHCPLDGQGASWLKVFVWISLITMVGSVAIYSGMKSRRQTRGRTFDGL